MRQNAEYFPIKLYEWPLNVLGGVPIGSPTSTVDFVCPDTVRILSWFRGSIILSPVIGQYD